MALVDTPIPTLNVHESARGVDYASFEGVRYAEYLDSRKVSEENITKLNLIVTEKGISCSAMATFGRSSDGFEIRFSASRMPRNTTRQNSVLFHETEHYIQECKYPYVVLASAGFTELGSAALGTAYYGINIGNSIYSSTEGLPITAKMAAVIVGGSVVGVLGGMSAFFASKGLYQELSPFEIQARRAAKREVKRQPSILQIGFK